MRRRERLLGGKADFMPDECFDADALMRGIHEEMEEHGASIDIAREIAKDHLVEDPSYYDVRGNSVPRRTKRKIHRRVPLTKAEKQQEKRELRESIERSYRRQDLGISESRHYRDPRHRKAEALKERRARERAERRGRGWATVRENAPEPSDKVREAYVKFHGVEPETMDEMRVWVPGPMVYLGPCLDIGYRPPKSSEKGQFHYVHDHKDGVKVYCRPDEAPDGTEPSLHYKKFPSEIWALGVNIGFTYKDRFDGEEYEVEGSNRLKLCTDGSGKRLYVVDREGVLFMVKGGDLKVTDWIRN